MTELQEFKMFSRLLADKSSEIIKKYFRTNILIDTKDDDSPVTIADKSAEELMRELISKEYPEHGILGEEFGLHNEDAEYRWVLDPIDGTKSFICGALSFGTLIALLKNGEPILGVFNQPILNEFLIGDNNSAKLNGVDVKVRECNSVEEAVMLTTDHFNVGNYHNQDNFDELAKRVKLYRQWGDCYGYYLVASGYVDIMIDPIMNAWDSMAVVPIIKGAGGIVTDYEGNNPVEGDSIVACSKQIHTDVINILNK